MTSTERKILCYDIAKLLDHISTPALYGVRSGLEDYLSKHPYPDLKLHANPSKVTATVQKTDAVTARKTGNRAPVASNFAQTL